MSLGFRRGHDHNASRRPVAPTHTPLPMTSSSSSDADPKRSLVCHLPVPRGFVPTLTYSLYALAIPILWFFVDPPDYTDNAIIGVTIGVSALTAFVVTLANDCCCWYNMMLFFHIGIESKVVDTALAYATAGTTSDHATALAITGVSVIILHLVPFLLLDSTMIMSLLAFAGVVVNTAVVVYTDSSLLLLVLASSSALLASTMIIGGVCEIRTSMLSLIKDAVSRRMCLTCQGFEL